MTTKDNKAFNDALTRFNGMCEAYISMFGENSLERVIVIHPNEITVEELDDSTKMLAAAMQIMNRSNNLMKNFGNMLDIKGCNFGKC